MYSNLLELSDSAGSATRPPFPSAPPVGRTILIIEDDEQMTDMLRALLGLVGHRVLLATEGAKGCVLAGLIQPDLIICDMDLPDMSGCEVLAHLRRHADTDQIPLIFHSGKAGPDPAGYGAALGAAQFIAKPSSLAELQAAITRHARRAGPRPPWRLSA